MKPLTCLKYIYFLILGVVSLLIMTLAPASGFATTIDAAEGIPAPHQAEQPPLVSITIKNLPIQQAASLIEKKTNYNLKLQSISLEKRVSGRFVETDIETVFSSLLRKYNLLILIDTKQHLMTVKSLGPKSDDGKSDLFSDDGVRAFVSEQDVHQIADGDAAPFGNKSEREQLAPFTGMTYADIVALHQKQASALERDQHNTENIAPFTGMTHSEINTLHEEQKRTLTDTQP